MSSIQKLSEVSEMKNHEAIRDAKNFDELLDVQYGKIGTKKRNTFEEKVQYFVISEVLKEARRQAQLAEKIGTKKSYISRLENGKCSSKFIEVIARNVDGDTKVLQREIDESVYKLYGLTEKEIAIVEGATKR